MGDVTLDRVKQTLAAAVRAFVGSRLDYLAMYACTVAVQNSDNSLELTPDDARLPPMSKVPLRLGLPGTTVKLGAQSRVLVGWYAGDPSKPFAALFEGSTITQVIVTCADVQIGGGTMQPATRGTDLNTYLTQLKTWLDLLVLPSPGGPAGPPVVASPAIGTITSATVKVRV